MVSKSADRRGVNLEDVPHHTTLLALVTWLQDRIEPDELVVATALELLRSGRVALTGNFAGCAVDVCFAAK